MKERSAKHEFWGLIAVSLAASAALVLVRSQLPISSEDQRTLGREKATWRGGADLVIAGDSRIVQGLRPEVFREAGLAAHPVNFGFSGLGYSEEYLTHLESLFASGGRRILICGVAPADFNEITMGGNAYSTAMNERPEYGEQVEVRLNVLSQVFFPRMAPLKPLELLYAARGNTAGAVRRTRPSLDGWLEADQTPRNREAPLTPAIEKMLFHRPDQGAIQRTFSRLAAIKATGIEVYCFWPPSEIRLRKIETKQTGISEGDLREEAERAGLIWIEVTPGKYPTYDGIHLPPEAALALSQDVADAIRKGDAEDAPLRLKRL